MSIFTDYELQRQVQQHTPLVEVLARALARKLPANVDCADLIQDGQVALINAILSKSKEVNAEHFKNYLAMRVQGAMLDGLRAMDHGSRQLRKEMRAVERAIQRLGHLLGRMPIESELAIELGMPLKKYQRMLQEASDYRLISLEDIVEMDPHSDIFFGSSDADPLGVLERGSLKQSMAAAMQGMSKQNGSVLHYYYVDELKMHQIGKLMRLTEARVSQIHAQAIAELRAKLADESGAIPALKPRRSSRTASVL
jgi:RNA polymerase sigma factor for flagellar operon FliA